MTPFRRDGHLTELAIDHLLENAPLSGSEDHVRDCSTCQARVAAADLVPLPALQFPAHASEAKAPAVPTPSNRPFLLALLAVAAAALLVFNLPVQVDDGIRVKGSGLSLQVFRDEGGTSARLHSGDEIQAGDRLGFRVRNRDEGHLMIIGLDGNGDGYLCYPQGEGGAAMPTTSNLSPATLPEAIRMDEVLGDEHLIAVLCEEPFTYEETVSSLQEGDAIPGCTTSEITLVKR